MLFYNIFALRMRPNQGLDTDFTAKGKKEGRKQGKFYVRISYGKCVVKCKPYTACLNAEQHCKIITPRIDDSMQSSSSPWAKHILPSNCPVMNVTSVADALTDTGDMRFKIPTHTPDINCTESVFHMMHKEIQQNVGEQGILRETFLQFQKQARNFIRDLSAYYIDRAIDSMWKRIDLWSNEMVKKQNTKNTK